MDTATAVFPEAAAATVPAPPASPGVCTARAPIACACAASAATLLSASIAVRVWGRLKMTRLRTIDVGRTLWCCTQPALHLSPMQDTSVDLRSVPQLTKVGEANRGGGQAQTADILVQNENEQLLRKSNTKPDKLGCFALCGARETVALLKYVVQHRSHVST